MSIKGRQELMPSIDPKAPGCIVTGADTGRIITSCAIFMSFFSFGGCLAALGSALPQIAHDQGVEETSLGYVFIARGSGECASLIHAYTVAVYHVLCDSMCLYMCSILSIVYQ